MAELWTSNSAKKWHAELERYDAVVANQGVARLAELDTWYRDELPGSIAARRTPHVTLPELVRIAEWKMARGVWRAPNLVLVRGNDPATVISASTSALRLAPHATTPIATLAELDGVGPATASGVMSAAAPHVYPFFDELVAAQVPALGKVAWTLPFYKRYADAIRARAAELANGWIPGMIERALWAHVGGKARFTA